LTIVGLLFDSSFSSAASSIFYGDVSLSAVSGVATESSFKRFIIVNTSEKTMMTTGGYSIDQILF
jgi:hypothetical protein